VRTAEARDRQPGPPHPRRAPPPVRIEASGLVLGCFRWRNERRLNMAGQVPFFNPKGIASLSPGLARFREGLPWVTAIINPPNPERVESRLAKLDASALWSRIRPIATNPPQYNQVQASTTKYNQVQPLRRTQNRKIARISRFLCEQFNSRTKREVCQPPAFGVESLPR
jgi:hypothetical protein